MDTGVFFAARLDECVFGGGCECDGVKVGIDYAQVATIEGATHDESFRVRWRDIKFHHVKFTVHLGEVDVFVVGSGNGDEIGSWCW